MSEIYSQTKAYDLYQHYLAVKKHFTSDYDYFKYGGKIKASLDSFERRKDKYQFYKLSKRSDAKQLVFANLLTNTSAWIGDIASPEGEQIYQEWRKRIESLTYTFEKDLKKLDKPLDVNFTVVDGANYPKVVELYMMGEISLETVVILTDLSKCLQYWEDKIYDTIIFPRMNRLVRGYSQFLDYDKSKMKAIVINKFKKQ